MHWPTFLLIASDATVLAIAGAALLLVAGYAAWADRRRQRRKVLDAVGCMPWTLLFLFAFVVAIMLLSLALKIWLAS